MTNPEPEGYETGTHRKNGRSGLIWRSFMSNSEIPAMQKAIGFCKDEAKLASDKGFREIANWFVIAKFCALWMGSKNYQRLD